MTFMAVGGLSQDPQLGSARVVFQVLFSRTKLSVFTGTRIFSYFVHKRYEMFFLVIFFAISTLRSQGYQLFGFLFPLGEIGMNWSN